MRLFVGNGSIEAFQQCCKLFGDCSILDSSTIIDDSKNYHTSISDVSPNRLNALLKQADIIEVGDLPEKDTITKTLLANNGIIPSPDIIGSAIDVASNQLVLFGCSHTAGSGLELNERFGHLLSNKLRLEELNFGKPGGGVAYSASVFHRCRFNVNQKVVFQISTIDRIYALTDQNQFKKLNLQNNLEGRIVANIPDDVLLANAYAAITNVIYTARNLNLNFVCFILSSQSELMDRLTLLLAGFKEFIPLYDYAQDFASDGHFGKLTHEFLSDLIADYYRNNDDKN